MTNVSITNYPYESPEKSLLTLGAGIEPFILIKVSENEEDSDDTDFEIIGSGLDTFEEVADMLEGVAEIARMAVDQNAAAEPEDD